MKTALALIISSLLARGVHPVRSGIFPEDTVNLATVTKTYRLEIVTALPKLPVKTRYGRITGAAAASGEVESYTPLFVREFSLYPADLVKNSRLKRIVFCRNLVFEDAYDSQPRAAIPDWDHNTLYLDINRGATDKRYMRKVIHHEFFHIIDYRDDRLISDERWARLNPREFKYGLGGRNAQRGDGSSLLTDKFPGFLNQYSTTAVEEDKAEVFANMMVEPSYINDRIRTDSVLRAKIERMKALLKHFSSAMNDMFWEKMNRGDHA